MDPETLIVIFVALAVGSIAKAVAGFGLPLVGVPVMATFLGVEHAVVIIVFPSFLSNLWMVVEYRRQALRIENFRVLLIAGPLGVVTGTWLLSSLPDRYLALLLAGVILFYLLTRLRRRAPRPNPRWARVMTPLVVFLGGGSQGATGASGPIVATYFHAQRLEPNAFVFVLSAVFMIYGATQMVSLTSFGLLTGPRLLEGLLALIPVVVVMPVGVWIAKRISPRGFDIAVLTLLTIMGARLAWQGIVGV